MTPAELIDAAERLLNEASPSTVSAWSRAAALLVRQALESTLSDFWRARVPGVERLTMRAQLDSARVFLDPKLGGEISYVWHALSRATHHHPYELDPTREELDSLLSIARAAIARIEAAMPAGFAPTPGPNARSARSG